ITRAVAKIALGLQHNMFLGNLSAQRDWGHAKDYVEAMWLILQQEHPEDFVIATGVTTTVRDFVRLSFAELGMEVEFSGRGEQEKGVIIDKDNAQLLAHGLDPNHIKLGQTVVKVDPAYYRPTEVDLLIGDASKAQMKLGWKPEYDLQRLISEMVFSDIKAMRKEQYLKEGGFDILNYFE